MLLSQFTDIKILQEFIYKELQSVLQPLTKSCLHLTYFYVGYLAQAPSPAHC